MKTFEINITCHIPNDPWTSAAPVVDYPDVVKGYYHPQKFIQGRLVRQTETVPLTLEGADEQITGLKTIKILFEYPIRRPVVFEFSNPKGFIRKDLFCCIYEGYLKIYGDEEKTEGKPEISGMLLNRPTTNGKYGVWGHIIEDLIIESVEESSPGFFELGMGS